MLIKLKFKLDEDEIPYGISDEEFNMILHRFRDVNITVDLSVPMNQLFAVNGHLIAYNSTLITSSFGVVNELIEEK